MMTGHLNLNPVLIVMPKTSKELLRPRSSYLKSLPDRRKPDKHAGLAQLPRMHTHVRRSSTPKTISSLVR